MENYPNPPITEALFDFQIEAGAALSVATLDSLATRVSDQYPDKKPRRKFEGRFEFKEGAAGQTQTIDLGIDGFLCWNSTKTEVVQFRLDGFGFSRLKPYQGWDKAFSNAMNYWKAYIEVANPTSVRRLVARYINTINVPHKKFELNQYLALAPQIPATDGEIQHFLSQVTFALPKDGAKANLIQTIGKSTDPLVTPLILDLEVIVEIGTDLDTSAVEKVFTNVRALKNELFEKCITEDSRRLFR